MFRQASVVVEERAVAGVDDVSEMMLGLVGVGLQWRLSDSLYAHSVGLALGTAGSAELGDPAAGALGGELGLRVVPWSTWPVRPYVYASAGLLLFPQKPFLPGADVYEFMLTSGVGVDLALDARLRLGMNAFAVHLSNGQGLGAYNPSYDGYGAGLALTYVLAPLEPQPNPWAGEPPRPGGTTGRQRWEPGVSLDGSLGEVSDANYWSGRGRLAQRVYEELLVLLDTEAGELAEEPFRELGLALVLHLDAMSAAAHGGWRRFVGLDTAVASLQFEVHVSSEVSVVAMGQHERTEILGATTRAAVGGRLFPTTSLLIDVGMGFDRIGMKEPGPFQEDRVAPYFGLEWAFLKRRGWQLALFVDRHVSALDQIGARIRYGMGSSLRDTARHEGWERLR
jgi:hypothetical protein